MQSSSRGFISPRTPDSMLGKRSQSQMWSEQEEVLAQYTAPLPSIPAPLELNTFSLRTRAVTERLHNLQSITCKYDTSPVLQRKEAEEKRARDGNNMATKSSPSKHHHQSTAANTTPRKITSLSSIIGGTPQSTKKGATNNSSTGSGDYAKTPKSPTSPKKVQIGTAAYKAHQEELQRLALEQHLSPPKKKEPIISPSRRQQRLAEQEEEEAKQQQLLTLTAGRGGVGRRTSPQQRTPNKTAVSEAHHLLLLSTGKGKKQQKVNATLQSRTSFSTPSPRRKTKANEEIGQDGDGLPVVLGSFTHMTPRWLHKSVATDTNPSVAGQQPTLLQQPTLALGAAALSLQQQVQRNSANMASRPTLTPSTSASLQPPRTRSPHPPPLALVSKTPEIASLGSIRTQKAATARTRVADSQNSTSSSANITKLSPVGLNDGFWADGVDAVLPLPDWQTLLWEDVYVHERKASKHLKNQYSTKINEKPAQPAKE